MKEFTNRISTQYQEKFAKPIAEKVLGFINVHPEIFAVSLLAVMCFLFLFVGLDFYPLLDVDETRYAIMSRDLLHSFDWNALMLNMEPFLEKPPLYFWLVAGSIKMLGSFSEFAVRLPIAVLATFLTFFTYYVGKIVLSRKFGLISALILLSSIFFLILSHIAIIDMVLTVFMTSAIYCGFLTHFASEKYKKYLWWYFYLFCGLGFLAKGILAIAIPVVVIFAYNFVTKTVKDIFKPVNMLPGLFVFFLIIFPWHFIMYLQYGEKFVREYFLMHHFARFINSETIGRQRPLLYFIPVFFLGFLPWSFAFVAFIIDGFKKLVAKYKETQGRVMDKVCALFETTTNEQKLLVFASLYFVIVFVIFSASSTKLPTYILPVFPAAALLTGYFWWSSDERSENYKAISLTTELFCAVFIIAAFSSTIAYCILPYDIQDKIDDFNTITTVGIYLLCILLLLRLKTKRALSVFSGYILTMFFIIAVGVTYLFNLVYSGGENEIVRYASFASEPPAQLVTFDFAVKPSAMMGYRGKVHFLTDPDFDKLDETLKYKAGPTFVIVKNRNMEDTEYAKKIDDRLQFVSYGEKYSLYVNQLDYDDDSVICQFFGCPDDDMQIMHKKMKRHHIKRHTRVKHYDSDDVYPDHGNDDDMDSDKNDVDDKD